jgi:hypothetical protein
MSEAPGPGPRPELRWLPVDRCAVDERYQRSLNSDRSMALVERIAAGFKWSCFQAVLAVKDGERWLILDGQHRVEAARRRKIKEVPAVVVSAGSIAEQAAAFVRANLDRVAVNAFALHHARLVAGEERAALIDRICQASGLSVPHYPIPADNLKPGQTLALGTISILITKLGEGGASLVLAAGAAAWPEKPGWLRASLLRALGKLYEQQPSDRRGAIERAGQWLKTQDPAKLFAKAQQRRSAYGGTEIDNLLVLLKHGAGAAASAAPPRAATATPLNGSGIKPPSREQLMGRR